MDTRQCLYPALPHELKARLESYRITQLRNVFGSLLAYGIYGGDSIPIMGTQLNFVQKVLLILELRHLGFSRGTDRPSHPHQSFKEILMRRVTYLSAIAVLVLCVLAPCAFAN